MSFSSVALILILVEIVMSLAIAFKSSDEILDEEFVLAFGNLVLAFLGADLLFLTLYSVYYFIGNNVIVW